MDWKSIWALVLIASKNIQFLSSWLVSLVKKVVKEDVKYLSQEFDNNIIDLFK